MTKRRWKAWAFLEPDETLYRIQLQNPADDETGRHFLKLGWFAVPVDVVERAALAEHVTKSEG